MARSLPSNIRRNPRRQGWSQTAKHHLGSCQKPHGLLRRSFNRQKRKAKEMSRVEIFIFGSHLATEISLSRTRFHFLDRKFLCLSTNRSYSRTLTVVLLEDYIIFFSEMFFPKKNRRKGVFPYWFLILWGETLKESTFVNLICSVVFQFFRNGNNCLKY